MVPKPPNAMVSHWVILENSGDYLKPKTCFCQAFYKVKITSVPMLKGKPLKVLPISVIIFISAAMLATSV